MKRLCESMLLPSRSNWLDLLRAAYLFNSPHLEVSVLAFLRDNISSIAEVPCILLVTYIQFYFLLLCQLNDFSQLSDEFPHLLPGAEDHCICVYCSAHNINYDLCRCDGASKMVLSLAAGAVAD